MKIRSLFLLLLLCALGLGVAGTVPALAFDPGPQGNGGSGPVIQPPQNGTWAQFFERSRRRDERGQRRQRREFDVMPLRNDPGQRQIELRELRRQERNRNQRQEQDAAREAVRRGDILPLGGIIRSAQSYCPGKFLGARLQRGGDGFLYRVRILRPSGQLVGLTVDAKSGAVVGGRCG